MIYSPLYEMPLKAKLYAHINPLSTIPASTPQLSQLQSTRGSSRHKAFNLGHTRLTIYNTGLPRSTSSGNSEYGLTRSFRRSYPPFPPFYTCSVSKCSANFPNRLLALLSDISTRIFTSHFGLDWEELYSRVLLLFLLGRGLT